MSMHTPGPWRRGKNGGVVADVPIEVGPGGSSDVEYYGGHLIAESIAPCNRAIIAAAPDLLAACKLALPFLRKWYLRLDPELLDDTNNSSSVADTIDAAISTAESAA